MEEKQVSFTAIMTAYLRAYHANNGNPKIFDDFLAHRLIPEERRGLIEQALQLKDFKSPASCTDQADSLASLLQDMGMPNVLSRSRYTEDTLEEAVRQGVGQYVILGAGLDTFAFRRPDLLEKLQVFEIDHPLTQAFKIGRIIELGWEQPKNLHFVPMDFLKDSLEAALARSPYKPSVKSLFSWLGVTMYLTPEAVFATLRSIADLALTGSIIVFDYLEKESFIPEKASPQLLNLREGLQQIGEPMRTGFDPTIIAFDLASLGLSLWEDLGPSDIQQRYFQGQTDSSYTCKHAHLIRAGVTKTR